VFSAGTSDTLPESADAGADIGDSTGDSAVTFVSVIVKSCLQNCNARMLAIVVLPVPVAPSSHHDDPASPERAMLDSIDRSAVFRQATSDKDDAR